MIHHITVGLDRASFQYLAKIDVLDIARKALLVVFRNTYVT